MLILQQQNEQFHTYTAISKTDVQENRATTANYQTFKCNVVQKDNFAQLALKITPTRHIHDKYK